MTRNATPSGVCAKTLPSIASTARISSLRGSGTGTGTSPPTTSHGRSWSSASADQNASRSASTSTRSDCCVPRASTPSRAPGDDRLELLVEHVAGLAHPVGDRAGRHRLGVQAQRGQRRTQSVGQVGGQFAFLVEQPAQVAGHRVEGGRGVAQLARAGRARPGRSGRRRRAGGSTRPARRVARTSRLPSRSANSTEPADQHDGQRAEGEPGRPDAAAHLVVRDEHLDDHGPAVAEHARLQVGDARRRRPRSPTGGTGRPARSSASVTWVVPTGSMPGQVHGEPARAAGDRAGDRVGQQLRVGVDGRAPRPSRRPAGGRR